MPQVIVDSGTTSAGNESSTPPEAILAGYEAQGSYFHGRRRHIPTRLRDIGEEVGTCQEGLIEDLDCDTRDDSTIGSWQEIATPITETAEDVQADASEKLSPESSRRPTAEDRKTFFEAIACGNVEVVAAKLDLGVNVEQERADEYTPLVVSIVAAEVEVMQLLLERGADVNRRVMGLTPIVHAVMKTHHAPQLIQLLMDYGASPNTTTEPDGMNALHWAAIDGMVDALDFLISKGMNLNNACSRGRTPLILAAEKGHTLIVQVLLAKGAELYRRSVTGGTALTWAAANGRLDTVKFLLQEGIDVDDCDNYGLTALLGASDMGHLEVVEFLLAKGADINRVTIATKSCSPAMAAATAGHTKVLQALVQHGADLKISKSDGTTILEATMLEGHLETVQALLGAIGGPEYPQDSVALQIAMASSHASIQSLIATASMMYPHFKSVHEPTKFEWVDWVLKTGGELVKPRAMSAMLHASLFENQLDMIECLLRHGCDPSQHLVSGNTPLSFAIRHGKVDLIRILLDAGADPAKPAQKPEGPVMTPLHQAIAALKYDRENDTTIVDMLLKTGRCKLLKGEHPRNTVFQYVLRQFDQSESGVAEVLAFRMLESIPNVNDDRCDDGSTLMHVAVRHSRADLVDILLEKGANIDATNGLGQTPFHLNCQRHKNILPFLLTRGADVFAKDKRGQSGLHVAAACGEIDNIKLLIAKGLDIEAKDLKGATPLLCALAAGKEEAALYLMDHGADPLIKCPAKSKNILHFAASSRMEKVIEKVLERGDVDINAKDHGCWTPLALACRNGSPNLVSTLLAAGANPEAIEDSYDTPLHISLITGNEEVALLLIDHGVNITAPGSAGRTPLHLAVEYDNPLATRRLLAKGVSIEALDESLCTPICMCGNAIIAQELVDNGANVHHVDEDGWTPLHHAVSINNLVTFRVLLTAGAELTTRTKDDGLSVHERVDRIVDTWRRQNFLDAIDELVGSKERLKTRIAMEKKYGLI
ncbi:ankyrin repeat-containing domain protein [Pyrenochaeta sp. MPI-SDFR-AT-0127]|nr:ankyrin repeat-containing domain protein [Pyrenochaeta sp. MPI-SDFR-AT-0127]